MNVCTHNVLDLSIISLASLSVNLRQHPLLNHLSFLLSLLLMFLFCLFLGAPEISFVLHVKQATSSNPCHF